MAEEKSAEESNEEEKAEENEESTEESNEEGKDESTGSKDGGKQVVSLGKYQRELGEKDKEIAELKAAASKAAESAESRKELEEKIASLEAKVEQEKLEASLRIAGCGTESKIKAAKALMDDYESVDKLKESEPWLFDAKKGSTGLKPEGAADDKKTRQEIADKAAGLI